MSDITERLEVCINSEDGYWPTILAKDAVNEITRLRDEVERYKGILNEVSEDCPNCPDQGYYVQGRTVAECCGNPLSSGECCGNPVAGCEPEQVQCEFCYTVKNSVFNITTLLEAK